MFSFIPLALVISLIVNAPALWDAFNNPQADLFGTLIRLVLVAVLVMVVLPIVNRVMGHYLAHPKIDVVTSSVVPEATDLDVGAEPVKAAGELGTGDGEGGAQ
tara:strand:+ start:199 stop:507 length:309 start_codon:yes stop_codon:yes gene_type:complete